MSKLGLAKRMRPSDEILGISNSEKVFIEDIDPELMFEYDGNPFNPYNDEDLEDLAESILKNGVLHPIIIRPLNDRYQILSGRNRFRAVRLAGLNSIPSIIKDVDDDTAALIVAETNLRQREKVLHSERARAYKMQMDALKRQGARNDLLQNLQKVDITAEIAKRAKDSKRNVHYHIRLLSLNKAFLIMVDNEKMPFHVGVELSYLPMEMQEQICIIFFRYHIKITLELARTIKQAHNDGKLNKEYLEQLLIPQENRPKPISAVKVPYKRIQTFFTKNESKKDIEEIIVEALRFYREHHN